MKSTFRFVRFLRFVVTSMLIGGTVFMTVPVLANAATVSVWWPENNATVSGTQPFKALVDGTPTSDYSMYWQVDNGALNPMSDNSTDAPHKEASVDVSGWNWQPSGTYQINIVAKDDSGNTIGQAGRTVSVAGGAGGQTPAPIAAPTAALAKTAAAPSSASVTASAPIKATLATAPAYSPVTASIASASTPHASVWWPTSDAHVTGIQPFKAVIDGMALSSYSMYWQVDNGALNKMTDSNIEGAHKEASVDLSTWKWNGSGPYTLAFVGKDSKGNEIARSSVSIYIDAVSSVQAQASPAPAPAQNSPQSQVQTPAQTQAKDIVPAVAPTTSNSGDPLSGLSFYVDPNSNAADQVAQWQSSRPADATEIQKISSQPAAKWLGDWNSNILNDTKSYVDAAASKGQVPIMIAYDIPQRDCGSYSAGGSNSPDGYKSWISNVANGIGNRSAVVILEPDALALTDCLSSADKATRNSLISYAITTLKAHSGTKVYVDAGNSNWISATDMASRLKAANIAAADGFALNVSNYYWTQDNVNFGTQVSNLIGGKHFVVDTSRNGAGPNGAEWCNPSGRALGQQVTTNTGNPIVDGYLWLKAPGESDGACNGGPSAGVWWGDYALGLAKRAAY